MKSASLCICFLEAKTEAELQRKLVKYQIARGGVVKLISVTTKNDGSYVLWFTDDVLIYQNLIKGIK